MTESKRAQFQDRLSRAESLDLPDEPEVMTESSGHLTTSDIAYGVSSAPGQNLDDDRPTDDAPAGDVAGDGAGDLLMDPRDREAMSSRWREIQSAFVDEPRRALQDADALVAGLMQHMAQVFTAEREQLEGQWSHGEQVSTEDLRVGLQRYRAFFNRLLSV